MTREEAMQILKESHITYIAPNGNELNNEAIDMAIEALQFQDIMENMPYTATPIPEVCKKCKELPIVRCKDCKHWRKWENGTGHCRRSENPHFWFGSDADDLR